MVYILGMFVLGLLFCIIGAWQWRVAYILDKHGGKTLGKVEKSLTGSTIIPIRRNTEYPIIGFEVDGKKYYIEGRVGIILIEQRKLNSEVEVVYNRNNPEVAVINSFWEKYGAVVIFITLGASFVFLPLTVIVLGLV